MKKNGSISYEYTLSESTVDRVSERLNEACTSFKIESRTAKRCRLSVEECLLIWLEKLGDEAEVRFEVGKRFFRPFFKISVKGEKCNPYEEHSEEFGAGEKNMLANVGLVPAYSYDGEKNILTFNIEKKSGNQFISLLIVAAFALCIGVLGKMFIPANVINILMNNIISPVEGVFYNILSCVAGPMIFVSVVWGVCGMGDINTLGSIGKKLMVNYLKVIFVFVLLGLLSYPFIGPPLNGMSVQSLRFGSLLQMVLGVFPSSIVSPFVENNTMQIIFLAFITGIALVFLGQRTSSAVKAIEQINSIITFLMTFVSKAVPYFVAVIIIRMFWSDSIKNFAGLWKLVVVFVATALLILIIFTLYISFKHKVKPLLFVKTCMPSVLIALVTASSSATYESNLRISHQKLGVSKTFSSFGIPFGMVLFDPITALFYLLMCFYFAGACADSVQVSISWIVVAVLICVVSAIATPPIPGGASATYAILFAQLGIPSSALAAAIAVDMVLDFFITASDMYVILLEVYHVSYKVDMRDKSVSA